MIVSGFLGKRKDKYANQWTKNVAYARLIFRKTMARERFFQILRGSSFYITKLQAINGDQQKN
jgi:hypothetical protein